MDFSEGDEFVGNIDLPKNIVDTYYENLTDAFRSIDKVSRYYARREAVQKT